MSQSRSVNIIWDAYAFGNNFTVYIYQPWFLPEDLCWEKVLSSIGVKLVANPHDQISTVPKSQIRYSKKRNAHTRMHAVYYTVETNTLESID